MKLNYTTPIGDSHHYDEFFTHLKNFGTPVHYQKNEIIFKEGGRANFVILVEKGVLRSSRIINDKEVVLGFTFPGDIDTSPVSFISQNASTETIETVCETSGVKVSRAAFFEELANFKSSKDILQAMLLSYIEVLIARQLESKAFTAEENYIKLLVEQPKLIQGIPIKDVASFLGISKERLSRIRKKHELT